MNFKNIHQFGIGDLVSGFYCNPPFSDENTWKTFQGQIIDNFLDDSFLVQTSEGRILVELYDKDIMWHGSLTPIHKVCSHCFNLWKIVERIEDIKKFVYQFEFNDDQLRPGRKVTPTNYTVMAFTTSRNKKFTNLKEK